MDIIEQFKKAIHTSEFWLLIATTVWAAVIAAWDPTKGWSDQVTAMAGIVGAAIWAAVRSWLKRGRIAAITTVATTPTTDTPAPALPVDDGGLDEYGDHADTESLPPADIGSEEVPEDGD